MMHFCHLIERCNHWNDQIATHILNIQKKVNNHLLLNLQSWETSQTSSNNTQKTAPSLVEERNEQWLVHFDKTVQVLAHRAS
jgi:hypothetical protein